MDSVYKNITLQLILAISRALEKLDERDYAAAEKILREAGQAVAGEPPTLLLR